MNYQINYSQIISFLLCLFLSNHVTASETSKCNLMTSETKEMSFSIDLTPFMPSTENRKMLFSVELAPFLPLPGEYGGLVETYEGAILGIYLNDGEDTTKSVSSIPFTYKKDIGIMLEIDRNKGVLFTNSKLVTNVSRNSINVDIKTPLVSGCNIYIKKGELEIPVVNKKTGNREYTVTYIIKDMGLIKWRENKPIWSGFTVVVTKE